MDTQYNNQQQQQPQQPVYQPQQPAYYPQQEEFSGGSKVLYFLLGFFVPFIGAFVLYFANNSASQAWRMKPALKFFIFGLAADVVVVFVFSMFLTMMYGGTNLLL